MFSDNLVKKITDLDAQPFCPEGLDVFDHRKSGLFEWDSSKVAFHFVTGQDNIINGHDLRKLLIGHPVLNANALDFLLAHKGIIPEEWKGFNIIFWGTTYCYPGGSRLFVRHLRWTKREWSSSYRWLGNKFSSRDPALIQVAI